MTPKNFISLLGKSAKSPEVETCLKSLGAKKSPKLKSGDVKVNVDLPKAGMYFVFDDEAWHKKTPGLKIGKGDLILNNVTFRSDKAPGYTTYNGDLPFGIKFSDSKESVISKLGEPEWANDNLGLARWRKEGFWVFVKYSDGNKSVKDMGIQVPDQIKS